MATTNSSGYSKEEVRLLAKHAGSAQEFIDSTRQHGGATISLHSAELIKPGQSAYIVGKEGSERTKEAVPTKFESAGQPHPSLSPKQFASNFIRLRGETSNPRAAMGSWVDEDAPHKGVQIDLSAAYKSKGAAERKMISRNEDAIWDMKKMENIRHEDVRHKYTDTPRPPKEN